MLFGKYDFFCQMETDSLLPSYKGSTFRGIFGHALKKVVCALKQQECHQCLLRSKCLYARVFETGLADQPATGSKIPSPPHPFVIEPPVTDETFFPKGSAFNFSLLLFGDSNYSLPYFIYAFDQMGKIGMGKQINGKRGSFSVQQVKCGEQSIYTQQDQTLHTPDKPDTIDLPCPLPQPTDQLAVKVILDTPLRLKFENRLNADLPFHILVRAMLRRISSLLNEFGDGEPDIDYKGLIQRAAKVPVINSDLKWLDWRRWSNRQEQAMLMGGITGSVTYEGHLGDYLPLLDLSSKIHLGKQTTFGLGKIRAEIV